MELDIRGLGLEPTAALRRHVERRLRHSLRSFDDQVERVTVRLVRAHGRSRHAPGRCQVTVFTNGVAPVRASHKHRSMRVAFSRALALARRGLARSSHAERDVPRSRRPIGLAEPSGATVPSPMPTCVPR